MSISPTSNSHTTLAMNVDLNKASPDTSDFTRGILELVNIAILTSFFCLLGIVSNLLNITVFYKQGMKSTVNISFMALSITDLINALLLQWVSITAYPLLLSSPDLAIVPKEISYYTSGMPHACVARITAWITVYITAERCICIAAPFAVKRGLTPRRTTLAIIVICVLSILPLIPKYLLFKLDWKPSPQSHHFKLGLVVRAEYSQLEGLTVLIYSVLMIISFLTVICLTLILIVQLNRMSKWRNNSKMKNDQAKALTSKDKIAIRTVVVIASFLIITFTPSFVMCALVYIVPDLALNGDLSNTFICAVSFTFLFDSINASMNAFLYYTITQRLQTDIEETFLC